MKLRREKMEGRGMDLKTIKLEEEGKMREREQRVGGGYISEWVGDEERESGSKMSEEARRIGMGKGGAERSQKRS